MGVMGLAEMCHVRVDEQSDAVFPSQLRPGSTQFDSVRQVCAFPPQLVLLLEGES